MSETKDTDLAALGCLGAVALLPLVTVYSVLLGGVTLQVLWAWFVVPLFHLPTLTLASACGIDVLVSVLRGVAPDREKTQAERDRSAIENLWVRLLSLTGFYAFALLVGFVIKAVWL